MSEVHCRVILHRPYMEIGEDVFGTDGDVSLTIIQAIPAGVGESKYEVEAIADQGSSHNHLTLSVPCPPSTMERIGHPGLAEEENKDVSLYYEIVDWNTIKGGSSVMTCFVEDLAPGFLWIQGKDTLDIWLASQKSISCAAVCRSGVGALDTLQLEVLAPSKDLPFDRGENLTELKPINTMAKTTVELVNLRKNILGQPFNV